jgi:hypothetical protein
MRATVTGRAVVAGIALLATVALAACSATQTPSSAGSANGHTTTPAAIAPASPAATEAASPSAGTSGTTPTGPGSVQNLVITSAEKSELTAAYLAFRGGIPLSDVAGEGPMAGSVYYAYDPATDTYWALAVFEPSSTASLDVQVGFQDGDNIGMFQKDGATAWQATSAGEPAYCAEAKYFPAAVLTAWSISAPTGLAC